MFIVILEELQLSFLRHYQRSLKLHIFLYFLQLQILLVIFIRGMQMYTVITVITIGNMQTVNIVFTWILHGSEENGHFAKEQ